MSAQHVTRFIHHPTRSQARLQGNEIKVYGNFLYQQAPETDTGLTLRTNGKTTLQANQPSHWQYATSKEVKPLNKYVELPANTREPINFYGQEGQLSIELQPHKDDPEVLPSLEGQDITQVINEIESLYGPILLVEFGDRGKKQFRSPNKLLTATGERVEHHLVRYRAEDRAFCEACWQRAETNRANNTPFYATQIGNLEQLVSQQRKNKHNIERHGPF